MEYADGIGDRAISFKGYYRRQFQKEYSAKGGSAIGTLGRDILGKGRCLLTRNVLSRHRAGFVSDTST